MDKNVVYEEKKDEFDIARLLSNPHCFLLPMNSFNRKAKIESEK